MKLKTLKRILLWAAPICWMGLIFFMSSRPGDEVNLPTLPLIDKAAHFLVFGMLALLLFEALFRERGKSIGSALIWAFVVTSIYGAIDEMHQLFVASRKCAIEDWLADIAGAALVLLILRRSLKKRTHKQI